MVRKLRLLKGGSCSTLWTWTGVAQQAKAAGVEVQIDVFPEMWHVFQLHAGTIPEADDAVARIARWLRPRLEL